MPDRTLRRIWYSVVRSTDSGDFFMLGILVCTLYQGTSEDVYCRFACMNSWKDDDTAVVD